MKSAGIKSYKQHRPRGEFDAIIIGSGIGGLTCAAIMAREGKRPLVLERHYTAGGFTHTFTRSGYEWDVGIHYIGGVTHPKAPLATYFHYLTGGKLAWADMGEVYDRVFFGDETFAFHKGPENFVARLQAEFPAAEDQRAIEQYFELVKQAVGTSRDFFTEKVLPLEMAAVVGPQMREPFLRFARQTTREVLEELTDNERLIGVLTAQFGDYGLPPRQSSFAMHAMVANHYFHGGGYPVGGAGRIAATIGDVLAEAGGLILVNAEVAEILVEDGAAQGVMLADGQVLRAPLVISDAGVHNTYLRLLPETVQQEIALPPAGEAVAPSVSHLCLYVGFCETAEALGLQKANYWIYPDGSYDHDANMAAFAADHDAPFPVVYISFPAAKDPDFERRYPGRATLEIITFGPYDWFAGWADRDWKRRGAEYEAFKETFSTRLLEVLYRYEPQLRGRVDYYELSTPLSTREFTNYARGEIYGLEHTPQRFEAGFLRPHTPVKNLYLTGQDIVTAGVGGALMGGMLTMSAIAQRDYPSEIRRKVLAEIATG